MNNIEATSGLDEQKKWYANKAVIQYAQPQGPTTGHQELPDPLLSGTPEGECWISPGTAIISQIRVGKPKFYKILKLNAMFEAVRGLAMPKLGHFLMILVS